MKKQVKKYGNTHVITLDSEDMKVHKLKVGEIIDIDIQKIGLKMDEGVASLETIGWIEDQIKVIKKMLKNKK